MSKCKICKKPYEKKNISHLVCSYECSLEYANKHLSKKKSLQKKAVNKKKKEFNWSDVKWLKVEAQKICNRAIRARDKKFHGNVCISCGYDFTKGGRVANAGHYMSQGGNSLWRYDERNIHLQCDQCNLHLSANLVPYRVNLIAKVGLEVVEELENTKTPKRWTVDELKEVIAVYSEKIKALS